MQRLYDYIQRFTVLSQAEFQELSSLLEVRQCSKKERITNIGEIEDNLYFISKGLIRKYFVNRQDEIITQIAKEGEFICSSVSFLSRKPSNYIVETLEPCTLLALSHSDTEKIYSLGYKMDKLGRLMILEWLLNKEAWEYQRLSLEPKERFLQFVDQHNDLINRVPQKYLASYLNIKPETFSRYKHLLKM
jgi:CRP-like cAMP-binding protein